MYPEISSHLMHKWQNFLRTGKIRIVNILNTIFPTDLKTKHPKDCSTRFLLKKKTFLKINLSIFLRFHESLDVFRTNYKSCLVRRKKIIAHFSNKKGIRGRNIKKYTNIFTIFTRWLLKIYMFFFKIGNITRCILLLQNHGIENYKFNKQNRNGKLHMKIHF